MFLSNRGSFRPETSGAYTLRRRGRRRPKSGSAIGACAVARLAGSGGPIGDYYGSANTVLGPHLVEERHRLNLGARHRLRDRAAEAAQVAQLGGVGIRRGRGRYALLAQRVGDHEAVHPIRLGAAQIARLALRAGHNGVDDRDGVAALGEDFIAAPPVAARGLHAHGHVAAAQVQVCDHAGQAVGVVSVGPRLHQEAALAVGDAHPVRSLGDVYSGVLLHFFLQSSLIRHRGGSGISRRAFP